MAFPEILDLNELIEQELVAEKEEGSEGLPEELTVSKCDDSSTTDSGSALDDEGCQGGPDLPPVNACDLSEELAVNKNGDVSTTENMLVQDGEACEGAISLPTTSACDINQVCRLQSSLSVTDSQSYKIPFYFIFNQFKILSVDHPYFVLCYK